MADASEAHKPHEDDLREWLKAFHADPVIAIGLVPNRIYRLLVDMRYVIGAELTTLGAEQIGG